MMLEKKSGKPGPVALIALVGLFGFYGCCNPMSAASDEFQAMSRETHSGRQEERGEAMMEKAMFGAGCFWGVEVVFRNIPGVLETAVGYSGGHRDHPTYREVCSGKTGHAEVVLIEFDPEQVSYERLLDVFWSNHDPTQLNRQGPDHGTQYRSVVFYYTPEQENAARQSLERWDRSGEFGRPIVTEISPAKSFWRAEEYHQRYLEKQGRAGCRL